MLRNPSMSAENRSFVTCERADCVKPRPMSLAGVHREVLLNQSSRTTLAHDLDDVAFAYYDPQCKPSEQTLTIDQDHYVCVAKTLAKLCHCETS